MAEPVMPSRRREPLLGCPVVTDERCTRHETPYCDCPDCQRRLRLRDDPLWAACNQHPSPLDLSPAETDRLSDALWAGPVLDLPSWLEDVRAFNHGQLFAGA